MDRTTEAASQAPARNDRITLREVSLITGLPRKRVLEAARLGHLLAYRPPTGVGGLVKYSKRSAESLAAAMAEPVPRTTMGDPDASDDPDAPSAGPLAGVPADAATPEAPAPATSPGVRRPRVGDEVRYQGGPAKVVRVYSEGSSFVPRGSMPVDLEFRTGHIMHTTTMTPHGPNSGWSWPDESPDDGEPRDDA